MNNFEALNNAVFGKHIEPGAPSGARHDQCAPKPTTWRGAAAIAHTSQLGNNATQELQERQMERVMLNVRFDLERCGGDQWDYV